MRRQECLPLRVNRRPPHQLDQRDPSGRLQDPSQLAEGDFWADPTRETQLTYDEVEDTIPVGKIIHFCLLKLNPPSELGVDSGFGRIHQ